jgi:pyruvate dehydrogenase complex dehydrogenase (E1) component
MRGSTDPDTLETGEWIDSLRAVLHYRGPDRAAFLIEQLTDEARSRQSPSGKGTVPVTRNATPSKFCTPLIAFQQHP